MAEPRVFLGLDFGTESVRAVVADSRGRMVGSAVAGYAHGQIVAGSSAAARLFPRGLPGLAALQHPGDWLDSAAEAVRGALERGGIGGERVAGIGVDFTSCTMLPCRRDGTPLCLERVGGGLSTLADDLHAWPKLWKHHGAIRQTERLNEVARRRGEPWLKRYGGIIGLEWFFPKMLEAIEESPCVAESAELWLEGGDWLVWMLTGGAASGGPVRSTCQAGYKGMWSPEGGFPPREYLAEVHPGLAAMAERALWGEFRAPGVAAGGLAAEVARAMGVREGTPVSTAIIDAHAGVPGAGVAEAGTLVMVMGTSGCHMLLSDRERFVRGVAGVVKDGILPGYFGYETGQAAMGDGFDLVRRLTGSADFAGLEAGAERVGAGADGVIALDWFNGCRTPLMDGELGGGFLGVRMSHTAAHLYRATLEATAFGLRWIVETLRDGDVPVTRFVATGGLAHASPLFMRIVASVLGEPVKIHAAEQGPALGAAILGALAAGSRAGGFDDVGEAVACMAGARSALGPARVVEPASEWRGVYDERYRVYRELADVMAGADSVMRRLGSHGT